MRGQSSFKGTGFELVKEYGGGTGKRKIQRPFSRRKPLHITMRAEQAQGKWSFVKHRAAIFFLIRETIARTGVKISHLSINGNHIHFLLSAKERKQMQKFLRILPGRIAMNITGARKGKPLLKRFWDEVAFSRIVEMGRDFRHVVNYIHRNILETLGLIPYQVRGRRPLNGIASSLRSSQRQVCRQ